MRSGLQQADVAESVGVTRVSVSNWERDVAMPTDENLEALAKLYRTTARDLRYGEWEEIPGPTQAQIEERVRRRMSPPHKVRVWLQEFQLELTREGLSVEEIAAIMTMLTGPDLQTVFGGHIGQKFDEERWLAGMQAVAQGIRASLKRAPARRVAEDPAQKGVMPVESFSGDADLATTAKKTAHRRRGGSR